MDPTGELQDLYSSTSSDDQSSINSVIHVETVGEPSDYDATADSSAARRETQNNETAARQGNDGNEMGRVRSETHPESGEMELSSHDGHFSDEEERLPDSRQVDFTFEDEQVARNARKQQGIDAQFLMEGDDSSSEDDDEEERRRREEEGAESDSSSTSEDTQIWVQHAKPRSHVHHAHQGTPNGQSRPRVPPKPGHHGTVVSPSGAVPPFKRQSLVSQSSGGKAETRLLLGIDDTIGAGDSGLSTESQETHSTQGETVHYSHPHDVQTTRSFVQYLPDPHSSTPAHGGPPHRPQSTSTTSSHPLGSYHPQKRASLGLSYQHSSPSHQSSRGSPIVALHPVPSPSPSPVPPTLLMRNGEPSSQSVGSPLDDSGSQMR